MRKITNAYNSIPGYQCFGCSQKNSIGLKMEFYEDDEEIVCFWNPEERFQGFHDTLHGGVISTLMDEMMFWTVAIILKTSGVTSKLEVKFSKPVSVSKDKLTMRARIVNVRRNLAELEAIMYNQDNVICASAKSVFFTFSPEVSKEKFYYPGIENFFMENN